MRLPDGSDHGPYTVGQAREISATGGLAPGCRLHFGDEWHPLHHLMPPPGLPAGARPAPSGIHVVGCLIGFVAGLVVSVAIRFALQALGIEGLAASGITAGTFVLVWIVVENLVKRAM